MDIFGSLLSWSLCSFGLKVVVIYISYQQSDLHLIGPHRMVRSLMGTIVLFANIWPLG